eukprot:TRINITY_DN3504_c0_g2_i1.p1 TRINITY_DN3504_c0_g2~~TRINITY_DN3504_c0_g2_i1.p1  ORF type:complete len:197 (-),score=65.67 TRINITY_DN3504_c0_g2_i1:47-637(-)
MNKVTKRKLFGKTEDSLFNQDQKRRSSGRLKIQSQTQNQKFKIDTEMRELIHNERLEALERDYLPQKQFANDEDDYIEDDEVFFVGNRKTKKKRQGNTPQSTNITNRKRTSSNLKPHLITTFSTLFENQRTEESIDKINNCNYFSAAASPSIFPARNFCSVCGILSNYTCTRCGQKYCSIKCNKTHSETRCLKFTI